MQVVPALNFESSAGGGPWLLPCRLGSGLLWMRPLCIAQSRGHSLRKRMLNKGCRNENFISLSLSNQLLSRHTWLVVIRVGRADTEHVHHCRRTLQPGTRFPGMGRGHATLHS